MNVYPLEPLQPKCPNLPGECPLCDIPYSAAPNLTGPAIPICPPFVEAGNIYQNFLTGVRVDRKRLWFRQFFPAGDEPVPIPASWEEPALRQSWRGYWYRKYYWIPESTTPPYGPDFWDSLLYWTDISLDIPSSYAIHLGLGEYWVVDVYDGRAGTIVWMQYADGGALPFNPNITVAQVSDPIELGPAQGFRWFIEYEICYDDVYVYLTTLQYTGSGHKIPSLMPILTAFSLLGLMSLAVSPSARFPKR